MAKSYFITKILLGFKFQSRVQGIFSWKKSVRCVVPNQWQLKVWGLLWWHQIRKLLVPLALPFCGLAPLVEGNKTGTFIHCVPCFGSSEDCNCQIVWRTDSQEPLQVFSMILWDSSGTFQSPPQCQTSLWEKKTKQNKNLPLNKDLDPAMIFSVLIFFE